MTIHDLDEESAEVIFKKHISHLHPGLRLWAVRIKNMSGYKYALYAVEAWMPRSK